MWNSRTLFTHIHSCEDISCVAHIHESRLVATPRPPSRPTPSTDGSRDRPRPRWLRSRDGEEWDSERARQSTTHCVERGRARSSERERSVGRPSSVGRHGRARKKRARDFNFHVDLVSRVNTHRHRPRPGGRRCTRGDARSIGAWRGRRRDDAQSPDVGETSTGWMGAGREARELGVGAGVGRRGDDGDARSERGPGESVADRLLGRMDDCVVLYEAVRTRNENGAVSSVQ